MGRCDLVCSRNFEEVFVLVDKCKKVRMGSIPGD